MAVGLPVVTTNAGGQSELVRDGMNGWLVPTSDPNALVRAMSDAARWTEEAKARGAAARRTIVTRFDPLLEAARLSEMLVKLDPASRTTSHDWAHRVSAHAGSELPNVGLQAIR
jgi:glycosyltransferase involved in cell wall biosynthesis